MEPITTQQWFDQYTSIDEHLAKLNKILTSPPFTRMPAIEERRMLEAGEVVPYIIKEYPLDTARADVEIEIEGDFILAYTDGDMTGCKVRLYNKMNDQIPLQAYNGVKVLRFFRFFLTTSAQAGKTLTLFIGREAAGETQPGTTTITTRQGFTVIKTLKATHFTGALAQFAKEDENLTGLLSDNIRLTGIGILSEQQLKFKALFWYKDSFENADVDLDEFCGEVELDIPTYGFQNAGAGTWYLDIRNLHLDYIDADASKELHVSLMNMSVAGKLAAGAGGNVRLLFTYETRT